MFEWIAFFDRHSIPYTTRAHNLSKGNIGTYCPLCNWPDKLDPNTWRLGISQTGKGWSCWSNQEHRGVRPHRLIQAFLNCSWEEACAIVGDDTPIMPAISERNFGSVIGGMLGKGVASFKKAGPLEFPATIPELSRRRTSAYSSCVNYLVTRGYARSDAEQLITEYGLRFPLAGVFRYRVVFPIEHPEGLVSWTGRHIHKGVDLRYRALSADSEKASKDDMPVASLSIHDCIWNARRAFREPRELLVVTEGPFDAVRIDFYGGNVARAVSLQGKALSEAQSALLADIAPIYKHRVLLLDPDAQIDSLRLLDRLDFLHFKAHRIKKKDPALLTFYEIQTMLRQLTRA